MLLLLKFKLFVFLFATCHFIKGQDCFFSDTASRNLAEVAELLSPNSDVESWTSLNTAKMEIPQTNLLYSLS